MIKYLLFIWLSFSTVAQIKNGSAQYNLTFGEDEKFKKSEISSFYELAKQNAKFITFTIDFNEKEMVFYTNEYLESDNQNISFSLSFSGVNGVYYKNKFDDFLFNQVEIEGLGNLVVQKDCVYNWNFTNETKMINDFLCYKATTTKTIDSFTFPVIAWYCPKIPAPYGPKGYGGLPGLILELQERSTLFGLVKIELNKQEAVNIKKPSKGKVVTEKQLEELLEKQIFDNHD
ncbi:GLPGLI family protein [Flavobacterium croceum]|uniref:GLPGLI family protein n=1 Tax=Flavobacterium croceum TaxID=370975 RepID=UPI0024A981A3|nr:GLPGLI family protein [Flavobacterium croceum]